MATRRSTYAIYVAFVSILVLAGLLSSGRPGWADPGRAGAAHGVARPEPGPPEKVPARSAKVPAKPEPVSQRDLGPRRANVESGARPPVERRKRSRAASTTGCGGGAVQFGEIYRCASLSGDRQDVFTVTTSVAGDVLYGTVTETANNDVTDSVGAMLFDAEGNYLCYYGPYPAGCAVGDAGTYTVVVALAYGAGDLAYTLALQSQRTPSTCRTLDDTFFSFASPGRTAELAHGSAGDCYAFDQPVGSVLQMYALRPSNNGDVRGEILDADSQPVCPVRDVYACTLSTPGPYRLMMAEQYGNAAGYTLRMSRISASTGCPELPPATFGDPGSAAGTGTFAGEDDLACHRLHVPSAGGVAVRVHNDQQIWWSLYDDAGREVCNRYENLRACPLPAAGDYTIVTRNRGWQQVTYRIAVPVLAGSAGCAADTALRWDEPAALWHQTSPVQTNCERFQGSAGQRVVVYASPTRYNYAYALLVDDAGRAFCPGDGEETGCVLPADGTYRVISYLDQWDADSADETYKVQIRGLSAPLGCPVVRPGAFNDAPAGAYGPIRCRTLRVTGPGEYRIGAYDGENNRQYAAVYDTTGHRICTSTRCEFPAAGDYTVVLATDGVVDNDFSYALSVLPPQPTSCPPLTQELLRGAFTAPGHVRCVQLPQSTGQRIVEFVPAETRYPPTQVYNSAGELICDSSYDLWQASCQLTGTAPYFAVLSQREGAAPGPFAARFPRVDGPPSCPAFGGAALTLTTGGDDFSVCRTIPADAHAARETFAWKRTAGTGGAYLSIFDANGIRRCGPTGTFPERTATCALPAGPLTVILDATEADATFELTRTS